MYCPNCGTQNASTNKFCMKCGAALPQMPAPAVSPVSPVPNNAVSQPQNPRAAAVSSGGLAGLAGGAISIVGWLMPWSSALFISASGLQITLTAFNGGFASLGTTRYSGGGGVLLAIIILFIAVVLVLVPLLGVLCVKSGFSLYGLQGQSAAEGSQYQIQRGLDQLRSRSVKGIVLMVSIFLVPIILAAVLSAASPGFFVLGQLGNLLPNSGYGAGFFIAAGGFILSYIGARYAHSQLSAAAVSTQK